MLLTTEGGIAKKTDSKLLFSGGIGIDDLRDRGEIIVQLVVRLNIWLQEI
jgi:hypothetical protein